MRLGAGLEMLDHGAELIGLERSHRKCRAELVDGRVVQRSHRPGHRSVSRNGNGSGAPSGAAVLEASVSRSLLSASRRRPLAVPCGTPVMVAISRYVCPAKYASSIAW